MASVEHLGPKTHVTEQDPHLAFPHCVIPLQPLALKMPSAGKAFLRVGNGESTFKMDGL